jgi:hypothetical protein
LKGNPVSGQLLNKMDNHRLILNYWFIFLVISLGVSVVTMTIVQVRSMWRERGNRPTRSGVETYWKDLSLLTRVCMYTGIVAIVVTMIADLLRRFF